MLGSFFATPANFVYFFFYKLATFGNRLCWIVPRVDQLWYQNSVDKKKGRQVQMPKHTRKKRQLIGSKGKDLIKGVSRLLKTDVIQITLHRFTLVEQNETICQFIIDERNGQIRMKEKNSFSFCRKAFANISNDALPQNL